MKNSILFKRISLLALAICLFSMFLSPVQAEDELVIGSYNLLRLGWQSKYGPKDYQKIAHIIKHQGFQIVAIQEVMKKGEEPLETIRKELGGDWDCKSSELLGKTRYKERYAFLWQPRIVKLNVSSKNPKVWSGGLRTNFVRPPFVADFWFTLGNTEKRFILINCHIYGTGVFPLQKRVELQSLDKIYGNLGTLNRDSYRIVLGDLNLRPKHFKQMHGLKIECYVDKPTTLNRNGEYFDCLDHFCFDSSEEIWKSVHFSAERVDLLSKYEGSSYRQTVSDHVPIKLVVRPRKESIFRFLKYKHK